MDIVYNRALVTGGLQDMIISNQLKLQIILGLGTGRKSVSSYEELDVVLEFLEKVKKDRWYTRAWVIQEAVSAGDNICLVFRRGPGVSVEAEPRIPTVRRGLQKHSLESNPRGQASNVVCLMVQEFRNIVEAAKVFLRQTAFISVPGHCINRDDRLGRAEKAINAAETLHPVFLEKTLSQMGAMGATVFGIRPTVDAAGALTLLNTRGCYHPEDRIAIMANMCGYEFRLSPRIIAKYCNSLRMALLALAIQNSDFSLLIPEMYAGSSATDDPKADLKLQEHRPGWVRPFDTDFGSLNHVTIRGFDFARIQDRDSRQGVVGFPAYLWDVSHGTIDLSPIKRQWAENWLKLKDVKTEIPPQKGEDDEAYESQSKAINTRLDMPDGYPLVKQELGLKGFIRNNSPFWSGIESYAGTANFKLILMAERMEASPEYQVIFSQIFFSILRLLFNQADVDPRAQGVADSIWQSMRVDEVNETRPFLPDNVCEALFEHPAVQQTPFQTIKLDRNHNDTVGYHQVWLFDRIMTNGNLYVGHYVPELDTGWKWHGSHLGRQAQEILENNKYSSQEKWEHIGRVFHIKPEQGSLIAQQLTQLIRMHTFTGTRISGYFEHRHDSERKATHDMYFKHGPMLAFRARVAGALAGESEDHRASKLCAVFDVDRSCTVAIPHDAAMEMIPHPSSRSMSTCWVVEVIGASTDTTTSAIDISSTTSLEVPSDESDSSIRVLDKVQGVWPIMQIPPMERYTVLDIRSMLSED